MMLYKNIYTPAIYLCNYRYINIIYILLFIEYYIYIIMCVKKINLNFKAAHSRVVYTTPTLIISQIRVFANGL